MNMFKLMLMGTALVPLFTMSIASSNQSFSGFYTGAQLGLSDKNSHVSHKVANSILQFKTKEAFASTGLLGGLHAGYGKQFSNQFYLGIEAFGNLINDKSSNKVNFRETVSNIANTSDLQDINYQINDSRIFSHKRHYSLGFALRPGIVFHNVLVNLILGIESTKSKRYNVNINQIQSVSYQQGPNNPPTTTFPYSSANNNLLSKSRSSFIPGFISGLEISFHAHDNILLGLRASHTFYRKQNNVKIQTTDIMIKASLLTGVVSSHALTLPRTSVCDFSGFYMGAQIGISNSNSHVTTNQQTELTQYTRNEKFASKSPIGGFHVGYGKQFSNRFYLGFEAFGNLMNNRSSNKTSLDENITKYSTMPYPVLINLQLDDRRIFKFKRKNSIGMALRPGVVFGDVLINAIVGIESARFKKYDLDFDQTTMTSQCFYFPTPPTVIPYVSKDEKLHSKRIFGFVPGLEISVPANEDKNIIVGLRATRTFYRKTDFVKTQATDIMIKASYKF